MPADMFKVIIVGSGPVGLTAAHALRKAGIDFLLLEQRPSPLMMSGNNLVLSSAGLRALYQLGLFDVINAVSVPLTNITSLDHNGRELSTQHWPEFSLKNFGRYDRIISRPDLTKVLYEILSAADQSKVLCNKRVHDIKETSTGVVVTCKDGSQYPGSFVVGADGAHSKVRDCMRSLALNYGSEEINEERPFLTTYKALWLHFPTPPGMEIGVEREVHGPGAAIQMFSGRTNTAAALYVKLDEPTRERVRHSAADEQDLVSRWGSLALSKTGTVTFRDIYESRHDGALVSLEEGVVKHWTCNGRVVLVGDAAHKFTPSAGAGCNMGIVDVIALTNELHKIKPLEHSVASSRTQLATAFKAYQESRFDAVTESWKESALLTATATWQTGLLWFFDRYVISTRIVQRFLAQQLASQIAKSPPLTSVEGEEILRGDTPWTQPIRA